MGAIRRNQYALWGNKEVLLSLNCTFVKNLHPVTLCNLMAFGGAGDRKKSGDKLALKKIDTTLTIARQMPPSHTNDCVISQLCMQTKIRMPASALEDTLYCQMF